MLPSGQIVQGFGYDGMIPGPTVHVERGTRVVAKVRNRLPEVHPMFGHRFATSTHLHGNPSLPEYDGYASDLTLQAGEVVGLAGLVGSGRTSLLMEAAGLGGRSGARPGVAFLPEDRAQLGLLHGLTVRENITVSRPRSFRHRLFGHLSRSRERRLCKEAMRRVGLSEATMEAPVDTLSGGNQQKALLARGLFGGARVWFLDEPTVGLDVQSRRHVLRLVRDVARGALGGPTTAEPAAAVLTSSDLDDLVGTCDVVHLVREGRLVGRVTAPFTEEQLTLMTAFGGSPETGPRAPNADLSAG